MHCRRCSPRRGCASTRRGTSGSDCSVLVPWINLVLYYGVLGPRAAWRSGVVASAGSEWSDVAPGVDEDADAGTEQVRRRHRDQRPAHSRLVARGRSGPRPLADRRIIPPMNTRLFSGALFSGALFACVLSLAAVGRGSGPADGPTEAIPAAAEHAECSHMAMLELPDVKITDATAVPAATTGTVRAAHCRVNGVIEKDIKFSLLLPDDWNRKFMMGGGG